MRTVLAASTLAAILILATLTSAPQLVAAQTSGNAPFCLKTSSGRLSCSYGSMAECEQARGSQSSNQCITRSEAGGTDGLGDTTTRTSPNSPPAAPERRQEDR
jgi:hypothetical protein